MNIKRIQDALYPGYVIVKADAGSQVHHDMALPSVAGQQPAGAPAQAQPDLEDDREVLTDEQIESAWGRCCRNEFESDYLSFARSIERAALSASPSAPAVQAEPVAHVVDNDKGESIIDTSLPIGTPLYTGAAPAGAAQAEPDKFAINKLWASAREVLAELFSAASKYKAAIESDTLGDQNEEDLTEALADAEHWLFTNIAAPARDTQQASMADAYAGAREDFAIWKKRALEAEESCRRLTAALNAEPASAAQTTTASASEDVLVFAIQVEKMLCAALGREWSASGISIESLITELVNRTPAPSRSAAPAGGEDARDAAIRDQALEDAAKEADHWQQIGNKDHKCGEYISAVIRGMKSDRAALSTMQQSTDTPAA